MAKIVADQRARQGGTGRPVLAVLAASVVLLGIVMVGLMTWIGKTSPTSPQQTTAEQTNNRASSANTSRVPTENPAYPSPAAPAAGTTGSTSPR